LKAARRERRFREAAGPPPVSIFAHLGRVKW
jgi:hypothetical protein